MTRGRLEEIRRTKDSMSTAELLIAISELAADLPGENMENVHEFAGKAGYALAEGFSEDEAIQLGLN